MLENLFTKIFQSYLVPWYKGLEDPVGTQEETLRRLLQTYSATQYGTTHNAENIEDIDDFRHEFPKLTYQEIEGLLEHVKRGNHRVFLAEPPKSWVMTRGSTGDPKILPATKTHLEEIMICGSRALLNYLKRNPETKLGKILNLSFPSRVAKIEVEDEPTDYGYSSGTYSRTHPSLGDAILVPSQVEIDRLGPGIRKIDWKNRFELIYEKASEDEIFAAIGVAPVILSFARHMKRVHGELPRDRWNLNAIFSTSVRKIQNRYAPLFEKYYGNISTIEIYSATEGVFAQQLDNLPYITPNYDRYLFEVETGSGLKMLHELRRGEWGRLIVSTTMFPRYDIGDMIEAMGKGYFRVFGRAKLTHILEHRLYRIFYGAFL
ncbi:MAG: GH3 auxin-responsive promoter family protein [Candidatus Bathyarchaeota archaeon]|jgi:hypothetical protein